MSDEEEVERGGDGDEPPTEAPNDECEQQEPGKEPCVGDRAMSEHEELSTGDRDMSEREDPTDNAIDLEEEHEEIDISEDAEQLRAR